MKVKRNRRFYSPEEKVKAVLLIWSDRRSVSALCREKQVSWTLVNHWQNLAMEGMVKALSPEVKEKLPALSERLEKLLQKKVTKRSGVVKLEERLKSIQQQKAPSAP
jgi:transposase-like protein